MANLGYNDSDGEFESVSTGNADLESHLDFGSERSTATPTVVIDDQDTATPVDETITVNDVGEFKEIQFILGVSTACTLNMRLGGVDLSSYNYNELSSGSLSYVTGATEFGILTEGNGGFGVGTIRFERRDRGLGTNRPAVTVDAAGRESTRMLDGYLDENITTNADEDQIRLWTDANATLKAVVREGDR